MYILDDLDKENLKNCEYLILTVFKNTIYLDNLNYEQGCLEEIITMNYTEDNLFLLKEDLKGFKYREEIIEEE